MKSENLNFVQVNSTIRWLETNNTDPISKRKLETKALAPNKSMKNLIGTFVERMSETETKIQTYIPRAWIQELLNSLKRGDVM